MEMNINRKLYDQKDMILHYLRDRVVESYGEIITIHGERDFKKRASAINKAIKNTTQNLSRVSGDNYLSRRLLLIYTLP